LLLMSDRWFSCCSWMLLVSFEARRERSFISFEARQQRSSGKTAVEFWRSGEMCQRKYWCSDEDSLDQTEMRSNSVLWTVSGPSRAVVVLCFVKLLCFGSNRESWDRTLCCELGPSVSFACFFFGPNR
jgi:hypothetical protein